MKLFLFVSMTVGAAFAAWFGAPGWRHFFLECSIAFIVAFVVGRVAGDAGMIGALAVLYLLPALISELHGEYYWPFNVVWTSWVLGSLLARADVARWHVPPKWRLPIAFWALILAVAWPVIAARECDFHWSLLYVEHIGNNGRGGLPWYEAAWVINVASIVAVGLLCLDWFFERFSGDEAGVDRFHRAVLTPLAIGMLLACGVALYQALVDITWLSGGQWPSHQRAPGTLLDADAFGALAAWWTIAFAAMALSPKMLRHLRAMGAVGFFMAWGALWASGSRMALAGGLIGLAFVGPAVFRVAWRSRRGPVVVAALGGAFIVAVLLAMYAPWSTQSPIARLKGVVPTTGAGGVRAFAVNMLWNRGAPYGTASVQMLKESPVVGVGPGSFHILFPDYAYLVSGLWADPDNAQSWYRHQLAELGILGSLGWIALAVSIGALLIVARPRAGYESEAGIVRGAIVAVALVSAVSMPGQHIADAFTVILLIFWYARVVDTSALGTPMLAGVPSRVVYRAAWALAIVFVAVTAYVGVTHLRPPMRAARADWGYAYGLYEPEVVDGRTSRWTQQNAVAVIPATKPWLRMVYWANHADIAQHPVEVNIWCDRKRVARTRLASGRPETVYFHVPSSDKRVMVETSVDHVVRPRDLGLPDDRELGLAVSWDFVDAPAASSAVDR